MPGQMPEERRPPGGRGDTAPNRKAGGSAAVSPGSSRGESSTGRRSWMVPLATFVVGLLLGAVIMGTGSARDPEGGVEPPSAAEPAATPTAEPSPRADATVTVPASCLELADGAEQLTRLVVDAAEAAAQLDAAELSGIVRQLETSQARLDELSADCRSGGAPSSP